MRETSKRAFPKEGKKPTLKIKLIIHKNHARIKPIKTKKPNKIKALFFIFFERLFSLEKFWLKSGK